MLQNISVVLQKLFLLINVYVVADLLECLNTACRSAYTEHIAVVRTKPDVCNLSICL